MAGISGSHELLGRIETEGAEALRLLEMCERQLQNALQPAYELATQFDTSLARLSVAGVLAQDIDTIKEMRTRLAQQITDSIRAIRQALDS